MLLLFVDVCDSEGAIVKNLVGEVVGGKDVGLDEGSYRVVGDDVGAAVFFCLHNLQSSPSLSEISRSLLCL